MTLYREYNELPQQSPTNCSWPGGVCLAEMIIKLKESWDILA